MCQVVHFPLEMSYIFTSHLLDISSKGPGVLLATLPSDWTTLLFFPRHNTYTDMTREEGGPPSFGSNWYTERSSDCIGIYL